jgi:hypothetical protein
MRDLSPFVVAIVAITAWMVITVTRIISRNRVREMQIRERIALIERGLVPPPEVDPAGFDRVMKRYEGDPWQRRHSPGSHLRAGIILIGVGVGVMLVITAGSGSIHVAIAQRFLRHSVRFSDRLVRSPVVSANSATTGAKSARKGPD